MDSKAIAVCLVLSVAVCDGTLPLVRHEFQQRQLPIPSVPTPPPCGSCVINVTTDFLAALKIFKSTYEKEMAIISDLRASQTKDLQETKAKMAKSLQDMRDAAIPALGQLSTAAATMGSCPALKAFFDNLIENVNAVFAAHIQKLPSALTGTDVASIAYAMKHTVTGSFPMLLTIYRDMLFNIVQVTPLCNALGKIIYIVFDSQGIGIKLISPFLNFGGSLVADFVTSAFGGLIPGNQAVPGSLDIFEILPILFCAYLGAAVVDVDLGEATEGFCSVGSVGGSLDPVGLFKELLCRFLAVIDPTVRDDGRVCAPGSSRGGGSAESQDLLSGLLCGVLDLVSLGELLECPKSGGPNPSEVLTGLICEIQNTLASFATSGVGISIPLCLSFIGSLF